jgi:hypothetical protein
MARGAIKFAALAGLAKQARDYARKNPDKVSSTIGKVEDAVGRKVGPKYSAHVGKGGKAVRSGLGITSAPPAPGVTPTDGTVPPQSAPPTV